MFYIVPKHFVQFACNFLVKDESVRLVVVPEAAAVQVCGAYRAENIVDHHDFGMVETAIVHIDGGPPFHQFVKFVEGGVRSKRDVGGRRNHNRDIHTSFDGALLMEDVGTKYGLTMCTFFCAE